MTENTEPIVRKISTIVDEDKNTKLHYSAANGNEEELLKDLKNEPKIDVENYLGWTPLMMACRNGHFNVVKLLLDHHADATRYNRYGMSVLLVSISNDYLEIVQLILQHLLCGGVSRQSMQMWFSPLSLAILFCNEYILEYLIDQNFNLNAATPITGITPLMFATAMENCSATSLLRSKGADETITNCIGFTAQGIIDYKNEKPGTRHKHTDFSKTQLPLVITTFPQEHQSQAQHLHEHNLQSQLPQTHPQVQIPPYIVISPQSFLQLPSYQIVSPHIRKSSNTLSPSPGYYVTTPNVTPITPLNVPPQVFFPPEFCPNQYYTANTVPTTYNNSYDFLNQRITPNNMYVSPTPQTINYPSPCV